MTEKLFCIDCSNEENLKFNSDFNLCEVLYNNFTENKDLEAVEIFVLNDDYIYFLNKKGIKDSLISRLEYINLNPEVDFNEIYNKSVCSKMVDSAILPLVIRNQLFEHNSTVLKFSKFQKKYLSDYFNNNINNLIFKKKFFVGDYILSVDRKETFKHEHELVGETVYGFDFGISQKYKDFHYDKEVIFSIGFIPVVALNPIPKVVTRDFAKTFISSYDGIIKNKFDLEKLEAFLNKDYEEDFIFLLSNSLIYSEELDVVIRAWLRDFNKQIHTDFNLVKLLQDIANSHKKAM